jgi:hypothetical protein
MPAANICLFLVPLRQLPPVEPYASVPANDRNGAIVLKNSFSAMFDFLGGYKRGIQKISWATSQFVDRAACKVLNRSEMVLSGDVPSNCNLASFRHARFFDFSTKSGKTGRQLISNRASAQRSR